MRSWRVRVDAGCPWFEGSSVFWSIVPKWLSIMLFKETSTSMMHKCMRQRSPNNNNNSITRFHHNLPVIWPSRFPALTWIHPWLKFPAREPWLVWSDGRDGSVWCENLLGAKEVIFQTHLYNILDILSIIIYCVHIIFVCLLFVWHYIIPKRYCTHASFRKTLKSYEEVDGAGGTKVIKLVHKHENSQSLLPTDGFAILLNRTTELFPKKKQNLKPILV